MSDLDRLKKFDQEHGGDPAFIRGMIVFADGAMRENQGNVYGGTWPPPKDEYERCELKIAYHDYHLKKAIKAFDERRAAYIATAQSRGVNSPACGPPTTAEEAIKILEELKAAVQERKDRLEEVQAELKRTRRWQQEEAHRELDNRGRQRIEEFIGAVTKIQI